MKFKIGDRVAVYDSGNRRCGTVSAIYEDKEIITVDFQGKGLGRRALFWTKQCRRLKPKSKAREWWIVWADALAYEVLPTKELAIEWAEARDISGWEVIKVCEVIEKPKPQGEK